MNQNVAKLGRQLLSIWKQLGLNQRISVVLAFGVVLAALFSLALWSSRVDFALLYGKLDDAEAAKVISVLEEMKVPHKAGQGGGAIYVPKDKVHLMRMQLASRGIPRGDGVGFEIFDKPNFGISDFVQRANYLRAIQGELSRTISQLDEVEAARVMIVLPENRLLVDNHKRPTASVFVRTRGQGQLPPSAVNSIRFLVANAVEGLQANQVTVVDNRGTVLSENSESDSLGGLSSSQLVARRNLEQYLGKKAEGMLEAVLGPGQAVVRVATEINFDQLTRTEEKFDPDGQVVRISTINDENVDSTTSGTGGGVPGVTSNIGTETNSTGGAPLNNNLTKKKVTNNQYEINKITSNLTQVAGGLKRVSAAVFVAAHYDGTGATRKLAPRPKEELEKLRHIVQSALGVQTSPDGANRDEITLEEMPFNDQFSEVTRDFGQLEKKQFWWNQIQNLLYPGLALVVFVVFWRVLKKTPAENIPLGVPLAELAGENGHGLPMRPRSLPTTVMSPEVFNQLVRENPANMTQAIQTWLSRGTTKLP
ncbi:MAG TPA: flagellar basal-body MS-ring/collar protein FliF [Verrucomicrobiae bacterium]